MSRYYDDYYSGNFTNQKLLNQAIAPSNQACLLQTNEANPLTVRLLVAAESIQQFEQVIEEETKKIKGGTKSLFQSWGVNQMPTGLRWNTAMIYDNSGSGIYRPEPYISDPYAVLRSSTLPPDFKRQNDQVVFTDGHSKAFPLIKAHISIYNFFVNYGSVLDRFSSEVNRLYGLGIPPRSLDWATLSNNSNLQNKDSELSIEIRNYAQGLAKRYLEYRNRLVHDGLIRVSAEVTSSNEWEVRVADDLSIPNSALNTNVLTLCQSAQQSLVNFLDISYGHILRKVSNDGQPPW